LETPSIGLAEEKRTKGKVIKANYVFQHFSNVDLATRKCPLGKITNLKHVWAVRNILRHPMAKVAQA
jgi:hypothetical protein